MPFVVLNAVLIGGFNDEEIAALAELTKQYPLDVRFIEMMPMYNSGDFDELQLPQKCAFTGRISPTRPIAPGS